MTTIVIYNNDIQGSLRSLKKIQQKEGIFRYIKNNKNFASNQTKRDRRLTEIIRRKIKERGEKLLRDQVIAVEQNTSMPFIFKLHKNVFKISDDNIVKIFDKKGDLLKKMDLKELDLELHDKE